MEYVYILLLLGVVLALCIFVNRVTDRLKVPSLLLFIGLGMVFGLIFRAVGIGNFTDYGLGNVVCSICLVFVIFYGGFGTNFKAAHPIVPQALLLSFAGTAMTAGLIGCCVYLIFHAVPFLGGIGWTESMLIGSVISSTDAASVFNILRTRRLNLKYNSSSLLEMESGSNDPVSYMLTVIFVAMLSVQYGLSGDQVSAGVVVGMIASQIGFGAIAGVVFGLLGILVLKRFSFNMGQGGTLFIVAIALVTYALPTMLPGVFSGNGYLAVYICGIMIGNARIPQKRDSVKVFDAITGAAQMMIFFLLGLLATPEWLVRPEVLLPAALIFVAMTFVVRPVVVGGLLAPFRAKARQIGIISWSGLRGVASIVFAIYALGNLGVSTLPYDLFSIVFVLVIISISVQGSLLPLMSRKMDMLDASENVMRTFNDYQDDSEVSFVKVVIGDNHPWANKKLRDCVMPREFLVVLIVRGDEVLVPNGETVVHSGDLLVTAAPEFENNEEFNMFEVYLGKNHEWVGKTVRELRMPHGTLIAMIKRKKQTVIPFGATRLMEQDTLVCIKLNAGTEEQSAVLAAGDAGK